jgi:hypothetical protein
MVVTIVYEDRYAQLAVVVHARGAFGSFLGSRQRRQQKRRQDRDNRNDHQQLNQRKGQSAINCLGTLGSGFPQVNFRVFHIRQFRFNDLPG